MISNPILESIMTKIKSMPASEWMSPTGKQLWRLAHKHAPPELHSLVIRELQGKAVFPKPTRCDENGNPLYCFEEVTEFFGKTPEEGRQAFDEMIADDPGQLDYIHHGETFAIQ